MVGQQACVVVVIGFMLAVIAIYASGKLRQVDISFDCSVELTMSCNICKLDCSLLYVCLLFGCNLLNSGTTVLSLFGFINCSLLFFKLPHFR